MSAGSVRETVRRDFRLRSGSGKRNLRHRDTDSRDRVNRTDRRALLLYGLSAVIA